MMNTMTETLNTATTTDAILETLDFAAPGPETYELGGTAGWTCLGEMPTCPSCGGPALCCPTEGCY